ncbi:TPA: hypothetical protein N6673_004441 [Escherichia coli]|nr:hypothetical protein [Escherichia coli]EFN3698984.1 hypothetical protein [Escherichia coli]EFO5029790.1 hypothetical protein [Escherichia coli]EFO5583551.1 hypothetical protein [Escherichia coli]EIG0460023.1 hypothetical protein [Escherichia coli]EJB9875155.1 hypothetical protein [Escherichia coli]
MIKNVALFALQPFQRQTGRHIVKDTHFLMKRRNNSGKFLSQYPGRFLLSEQRGHFAQDILDRPADFLGLITGGLITRKPKLTVEPRSGKQRRKDRSNQTCVHNILLKDGHEAT